MDIGRHWGSTASIILGVLSFAGSVANPEYQGGLVAGPIMIFAGLACRSAKKRNLGASKKPKARIAMEALAVAAILFLWLGQNQLATRMATDPAPNLIIPVLALVAYAVAALRKPKPAQV